MLDAHRNDLPSAPFCTFFCGSKGPSALRELVYVCLGISLECLHYVCHFAHRHRLMGLFVSWTGTHSYSLQVRPPVLCPCPASGFSPLHLQLHYKPQCSTKAAPVQIPSLAPYYSLSKGPMLAAGLQIAELLQAPLVLLSQKSLLDCWPLAVAERPGEYKGKTPELGCREWHRQSRWGVLRGNVFCHESNTQSASGPENPPSHLKSSAQLLTPEPSLCSPVKIALCEV